MGAEPAIQIDPDSTLASKQSVMVRSEEEMQKKNKKIIKNSTTLVG